MDVGQLIDGPHNLIPTSAGCIGLLILISYVFNTFFRSNKKLQRLPPGPKRKPIIGNLLDLPPPGSNPSIHWTRHRELYGPISSLTFLGRTMIILNDHKIAKELLEKQSTKTSGRPQFVFAGDLCGYDKGIIFTQPGADFRQMRKFTHTQLGSNMALAKWSNEIDVEVRRYLLRTLENPEKYYQHIQLEAASIILKIVYGYQTEPHSNDVLVDLIGEAMHEFGQAVLPGEWLVDTMPFLKYVPSWVPGASFQKTAKKWWKHNWDAATLPFDFAKKQIEQGEAPPSLVSESIAKGEGGVPLTPELEENLKWVSMALYAGGADTTVGMMAFFYMAMIQYPEVQRKAQAEIDAVLGGASRLPEPSDRAKMPYIEAVFKENMRWEPIADMAIPHRATEDVEYEGYTIPKDAIIGAHMHGMFHDETIYKSPSEFRPERFLGENPELDPNEINWGWGRRVCPGRFLATSNLWLQIARTLACFDIKAVPGKEPVMKFLPGLLRHPPPFEADIRARSPEWETLVRQVATTNPLPAHGDARSL